MQGGYVEALVFLGDNKDYNRQAGTFGRVILPKHNFSRSKGT